MGTDKTALFIERYRQRAITCSHLKNRILFAIFFNKKFNQCFGITFSLIFGSCRNVLDFKYAFSFIGYDTLAFDSVIVKHIHRAMVEVTVYHILLVADRLCEKYGLYYNPNPNRSKQSSYYYKQEQAGMPSRYSITRDAIDEAIAHSTNLKTFDYILTQMGYWTIMNTALLSVLSMTRKQI